MKEAFQKDLIRGSKAEYYILNQVKERYPNARKIEGYFKEYDIIVPEVNKTIEVKFDEMSLTTGNLVVEIEFDGKPSALSTTKTDYWVFVSSKFDIWIRPETIRYCIEKYNIPLRSFIGDGDDKEKKAYLVPTWIIKQNCIKQKSK